MFTEYDKAIIRAKKKYNEAVRGAQYQSELLKKSNTALETTLLEKRKAVFIAEMCILEDVFGASLLNKY